MRNPILCICENKGSDQPLFSLDSTMPPLPKSEYASLWPSSVAVQPGFCPTWSVTPMIVFFHEAAHILGLAEQAGLSHTWSKASSRRQGQVIFRNDTG